MEEIYVFPPFITDPPGCIVDYSYSVPDASGVVDDFNSDTRTFRFYYADDLLYCGDTQKTYTVNINGSTGNRSSTKKSTIAFFKLTVKNPCGRSDLIKLETNPLPDDFTYTPYSSPKVVTHDAYAIRTSPITHSLCNSITYSASWTGTPTELTKTTSPMKYDPLKRRVTIRSNDANLVGEYTIFINAHITGWPDNKSPTQSFKVNVLDPCENASITAPEQPAFGILKYEYESVEVPTIVVEFNTN